MLFGSIITILFTVIMLILFWMGSVNVWTLFLPMPFIYIGESLVYANASSLILTHAKNKSYASATMGFITMGSCAATLFIAGSALMPLIFTAIAVFMLLLLGALKKLSLPK